jgi:hypothetical protein
MMTFEQNTADKLAAKPATNTPASSTADSPTSLSAEAPSTDVDKLVADSVAKAMAERDAKEADARRRADLRATLVHKFFNGRHELAEYLPDTGDAAALEAAAMKIRKSFLSHLPDIGGVGKEGGTPASRSGVDLSQVPAHTLISSGLHQLIKR